MEQEEGRLNTIHDGRGEEEERGSLMQTGNTAASHDGLVAEVEVDAQEYANSVIATFHVLLNVFLHTQERGREVGRERGR